MTLKVRAGVLLLAAAVGAPCLACGTRSSLPGEAPDDVSTTVGVEDDVGTSIADCFAVSGGSRPEALNLLRYQWGTDSYLLIGGSCEMRLRRSLGEGSSSATLSKEDCAAVSTWATSDAWFNALVIESEPARLCLASRERTSEFFETSLFVVHGLRTDRCRVEPFVRARTCLAKVIAKYFPAK